MGKLLQALADENLCIDPPTYRGNQKYCEAMSCAHKLQEQLNQRLDEDGRALLEDVLDAYEDMNRYYWVDKFARGYSLGVLMTMEVYEDKDSFFFEAEANSPQPPCNPS